MRRSTALAATVLALLLAASVVLASDGPVLSFSVTTQQVTIHQAQQLALQLERSAARRRLGVDRPVLVPRYRPPSPSELPTASAPTQPAPTAKPAPSPRAAAPLPRPAAPKPARRASSAAAEPVRTGSSTEPSTSSAPKLQLPPMNPGVSRELIKDAKQALDPTPPRGEGTAPR